MSEKIYVTQAGLEELRKEYNRLKQMVIDGQHLMK